MSHLAVDPVEIARGTRLPSATVGMIGAGQLARMTHQAAIALNIELRVLTDDLNAPAVRGGATPVLGSPKHPRDLQKLAAGCDVVTFDHELAEPQLLAELSRHVTVRPSPRAKQLAQDKLHARETLSQAGFRVPSFAPVDSSTDIDAFAERHGWPVVIKARRGGYDGRGVWITGDTREAARIWQSASAAGRELLVESFVDIRCELAVLVARRPSGDSVTYPVMETRQQDAICREVIAPAAIPVDRADEARRLAVSIADGVDVAGLLAVELFLTGEGLVVNELALRPHNCGHLTIDACPTSQFEQHLRAILDWPLGDTGMLAPAAAMVNVLGPPDGSDPATRLADALAVPQARMHLYAKTATRGRKLGHVTALGQDSDEALRHARSAAAALVGR